MDNGRKQCRFSEGGRMGFEPVENVGLAGKRECAGNFENFQPGARAKGLSLVAT